MRVLLISEGFHEHADTNWGEPADTGALQVLVRRILNREIEIENRKPNDREFRRIRIHGKGHAYEKVVLSFLNEAERREFDAVVFLIDEDGDRDRRVAMDLAQQDRRSSLPRACGVAIRSFDAWILADESALAAILESDPVIERDPERVKRPKSICVQRRNESGCGLRLRDLYAAYASHVDLELLKRRCPQGFAVFAERVASLTLSAGA